MKSWRCGKKKADTAHYFAYYNILTISMI